MAYCGSSVPDTRLKKSAIQVHTFFLSGFRCLYVSGINESANVVHPARFSRRCGRLHNPQPYFYLEEKSMKKVLALLIFAGLCTAVFVSTPISSKAKNDKLRKNSKKVENSYIVVL